MTLYYSLVSTIELLPSGFCSLCLVHCSYHSSYGRGSAVGDVLPKSTQLNTDRPVRMEAD